MQKLEWKGFEELYRKIRAKSLESQAFGGGISSLHVENERVCSSCGLPLEPSAKCGGHSSLSLCEIVDA